MEYTPFAEYKGTELSNEIIEKYFVEPRYIAKMYNNGVAFIVGQRGTGKTTMLKHLCTTYNSIDGKAKNKLGIYYRFDVNRTHSFSGSDLSDEEWEKLFAHSFSIEICKEIVELLIQLKPEWQLSRQKSICQKIRNLFFDESDILVSDLETLYQYLEDIDYITKKYKRNPHRAPLPMISECEKTFETFCRLISEDDCFKGVCVHFLFDEYENMLDYQKKYINSCIKNASYYHTYKICVRPYGIQTYNTSKSTEILREADDFKTLDYIKDIIGDSDDVAIFMKQACKRRLEEYYTKNNIQFTTEDLDIVRYFPESQSDDELFHKLSNNSDYLKKIEKEVSRAFLDNDLKYKFKWDLMQMKLFLAIIQKRSINIESVISSFELKDSTYKNWVNNYKKSILFLCYSEQNIPYEMSGFDDVIKIAGDVVRYVLEICDYCFLCTTPTQRGTFSKISSKMQTEATYKVSSRRFEQIATIPYYGQEIKQMILIIGTIFNMYHKDTQLRKFEPNHFSIERKTSKKYQKSEIHKAIELCIIYGILVPERSTKIINKSDIPIDDEDYCFHPILTPHFQISWRKKQKCRFSLSEINDFLFTDDANVSQVIRDYMKKAKMELETDPQISLFDL